MRITPLAVWARHLSTVNLDKCVTADVSMMHSKKSMHYTCIAYCIAIKTLIMNLEEPNRAQLAVQAVLDYAGRGHSPTICNWVQTAQRLAAEVKAMEE